MHLTELVRLALEEDVGNGDLTTEATVPAGRRGEAHIRAKQPLVLCGNAEAAEVFRQVGAAYQPLLEDGARVEPGVVFAQVRGPLRALLTGERVALNLLMQLSGIATHTRRFVEGAPGLRVVDTRKTTPLWRASQRRAVRIGGAANHRFALYDGILIKDNHIVAAGGITAAVRAARSAAHHLLRIEVECESAAEVEEALAAGAEVIMLDNMDDAQVGAVISRHRGQALFEISGNVSAARLPILAALGVDLVSVGGLIHQATWADISMKLRIVETDLS
ncbi:MAG: carboxylating nicotinate-nucleotide diphosphorylase [Deltaproteobacteria bacterium]|nr:carboxylating nicotinate-nucleotide diphosphorylase [Deltaproteobacteria bacterium]